MISGKQDVPALANHIGCLSMFEQRVSVLYGRLSEKTENPIARSLLFSISKDSSKHSTLLKAISDSISVTNVKERDCEKNLGLIWQVVTDYFKELKSVEENKLSSQELYEKLMILESSIGEDYFVFVQMQTLRCLSREINQVYTVNLETIKRIFENIIQDEEHHREILTMLKEMSEPKKKEYDCVPIVKYQYPNHWIDI